MSPRLVGAGGQFAARVVGFTSFDLKRRCSSPVYAQRLPRTANVAGTQALVSFVPLAPSVFCFSPLKRFRRFALSPTRTARRRRSDATVIAR